MSVDTAPGSTPSERRAISLFQPEIVKRALLDSVLKLDPRVQIRNPVMFVVEIGAVITTVTWLIQVFGGKALGGNDPAWYTFVISFWLWLTVVFANMAEAFAEGRGRAQADTLRAMRQETIVSERAWLFAVATNLVRDEARKDARRRHRLELLREQARVDEVVEPEPLAIERAQEAALARKALDMLVERDREALLMREEGLDYTEIASALELSVGSVGTTLARARRRLVDAYESLQQGGSVGRGTHAAS